MKRILSLCLLLVLVSGIMASCQSSKPNGSYDFDLNEYIDLGEYKGLEAVAAKNETDEEETLRTTVLATLYKYARAQEVDRESKMGDIVYIDAIGRIDGVIYGGTSTTNHAVTIGGGEIGDEFENNLIGHKKGDKFSFEITVPDSQAELEALRGKTVHYDITINSVNAQELPQYTDEFVKAYLGYDSKEAYEAYLREEMKKTYMGTFYSAVIGQVWSKVCDSTTVKKYPQAKVREKYDGYLSSLKNFYESASLTMSQFALAYYNMTEEELLESIQAEAESKVKEEMICHEIAKREGITVTDEDYAERAPRFAKTYSLESVEELEAKFTKDQIKDGILLEKVQERVADLASITYAAPENITTQDSAETN
ncbi:MAG: hypothetical protein IJU57_03610 [Clostridia bacterium]|nr:hypothetical protein [Clostridia bacterium]